MTTSRQRVRDLLAGKPVDRIPNSLGGLIFAGVHKLPGDTPEEHLRAMLQAYRDCRSLGSSLGGER